MSVRPHFHKRLTMYNKQYYGCYKPDACGRIVTLRFFADADLCNLIAKLKLVWTLWPAGRLTEHYRDEASYVPLMDGRTDAAAAAAEPNEAWRQRWQRWCDQWRQWTRPQRAVIRLQRQMAAAAAVATTQTAYHRRLRRVLAATILFIAS